MGKLKYFLQTKPVFLYLLPVFFVLHSFTENFHFSLAKQGIVLAITYLLISLLISFLFWFLFKNYYKAAFITFFIMAFNLFFGSVHDFLKNNFGNIVIVKYIFIIPAVLILLTLLTIYTKKRIRNVFRIGTFLSFVLIVLIIIDIATLLILFNNSNRKYSTDLSKEFIECDTCARPDIYLIIADEYAGSNELKDIFSFDNTAFENELKKRGFHIINNTRSNYNTTVYSMASLFDMNYIYHLETKIINHRDMFTCREIIKNGGLHSFLKKYDYEVFNYSPFDFGNKKKFILSPFFVPAKDLFTAQTFLSRIQRDLGYHFYSISKIKKEWDRHKSNNVEIDNATRTMAQIKIKNPKFIYTHLALPHHPYYYDSSGTKSLYDSVTLSYPGGKNNYLQYLLYSNKKLLSLIDFIRKNNPTPPIIILMSDHGYRKFEKTEKVDSKYYFMNLNTVFMPNGNYAGFYDGMSNVNQFRVILNSEFGQKLPLLKDSTSFLVEQRKY